MIVRTNSPDLERVLIYPSADAMLIQLFISDHPKFVGWFGNETITINLLAYNLTDGLWQMNERSKTIIILPSTEAEQAFFANAVMVSQATRTGINVVLVAQQERPQGYEATIETVV